ncbi:MAG: hypothetical protein RIS64_2536, partial [Bacteroidota bacterium]
KPKILWLGYAIFNYFIFSIWQYVQLPISHVFRPLFMVLLGFFYGRFVVQAILMFWLKKWQPPMGMAYNLLCISVLSLFIMKIFKTNSIEIIVDHSVKLLFYIIGILLTLVTDTYYAYSFFKIVGRETMGAQAIWYASDEDPQFRRINRITKYLNCFFYTLTFYIIILYSI